MALVSDFNPNSVEGTQELDSGDLQRVVMTNNVSADDVTVSKYSTTSVQVLVEDSEGNEQLCVATCNFGSVTTSSVESVNGETGQIVLTGEDINVNTDEDAPTIADDLLVVKTDIGTLSTGLETAQNDIDGLGDQVSAIEGKIPDDASTENQLVTSSDIANFLDKTDTNDQTIAGNVDIQADLTVMGDAIFETANPICEATETYGNLDDGALVTKSNVESRVSGILPAYPSEDGTYVLKYVLEDGVGTLSWVLEE